MTADLIALKRLTSILVEMIILKVTDNRKPSCSEWELGQAFILFILIVLMHCIPF